MSLRILMLGLNYAPEPTGIAPYTTATARFLADAGHEVRVVTGLPHYPHWKVADGYRGPRMRHADGQVQVTRVWHPVPAVPSTRGRIGAELAFAMHAATVAGPRPDVVLAVSPALLTVATALRHRGARVGVVTQDLYGAAVAETGMLGSRSARAVEGLERALLSRCDGVVAIHDAFADSLVRLGVTRERIRVIRNWTHVRPATGDRAVVRKELGWRDDETVVLHAGNMGAKQGLENVIDAAKLARSSGLPVRFVLMGDGNRRRELETRASQGLETSAVDFLDPVPDAAFADVLAAADLLLLNERPGIAEMCVPSKLTSYFAAGRPVIAATGPRSAATREIEASGGGLTIAPGDPQALVDAAVTLGMDPLAADLMGARGTTYATTVLTEATAREAYVSWVEGMVGPTIPAPRRPLPAPAVVRRPPEKV